MKNKNPKISISVWLDEIEDSLNLAFKNLRAAGKIENLSLRIDMLEDSLKESIKATNRLFILLKDAIKGNL